MYKYNLSRFSLITLLDLINISDEKGQVQIYYKDLVDIVQCSEAQFYNVLRDLEEIGIIKRCRNKEYKNEIDITIIDNDFTNSYRNYVDTNKVFFTERQYREMKAGEIRLYLYFLFRVVKQKYKYNEETNNDKNRLFYTDTTSYKKIEKQTGIKSRMVKYYCQLLKTKSCICVGEQIDIKCRKYDVITINKEKTKVPTIFVTEKGKKTEIESKPLHIHWCYYIKNLCRRHGKSYDALNLNDTAILFNQYEKTAMKKNKNIYKVLTNAVLNFEDTILDSKIIHYIVRSLIALDYTESIIAY